jgi:hypothetical protein
MRAAAAAAGAGAPSAGRAGLAFEYAPDDPEANAAALTALETAAAREGRAADFLTLRRMRRAAGLKAADAPGGRPEMAFTLDFDDREATCLSIVNALQWAMEEKRHADVRELEKLLRLVERTFGKLEGDRRRAARRVSGWD